VFEQHRHWFVDLQSGFYFTGDTDTTLHGVPGALAMHGARDIKVTNCSFEHLGLSGVLASNTITDKGAVTFIKRGRG